MNYQIIIDDHIGDWWLDTDKASIRRKMESYKGKHVYMKISSLGGSLDDGLDIRQQLLDHGDVTCYLSGFVASAATVIAMGAKTVKMGKYAFFLVHRCSNFVEIWKQVNAKDIESIIADLQKLHDENDKIDRVLAAMYAARCKNHTEEELMALLDESKWLTAQEALEWGFVDEIVDQPEEDAPEVTKAMAKKFNAVGLPLAGLEIQNESLSSRILHEVLDAVRGLSSKLDSRATEVTNHNTEPSMKKLISFLALSMVLAMDKFECEEGGTCQLTDEQLGMLDAKLNELNAQHDADQQAIAERDTTIAELREQVANLQKAPGEETTKVDETTGEGAPAATTSKDLYDSIKDII